MFTESAKWIYPKFRWSSELKGFSLSTFTSNSSATLDLKPSQPEDLKPATFLKMIFFTDTFVLFCNFVKLFVSKQSVDLNIPHGISAGFQNGFGKFAVDL